MKKIVSFVMAVILVMVMSMSVFAEESVKFVFSGDSQGKSGDELTINVKMEASADMGVFSGTIEGNDSIEDLNVDGKNGWNLLAYENGKFKLVKATGGKNEDVMEVDVTVKDNATQNPKITIKNIEMTSIDYETVKVDNIEKEISLKNDGEEGEEQKHDEEQHEDEEQGDEKDEKQLESIEITKAPTKIKYTEGEKFDPTGMEVIAKYSDGSSKNVTSLTVSSIQDLTENDKSVTISYTEDGITKTAIQNITVEKKIIPSNNTTNNTSNNTVNNNTAKNETKNNTTVNNATNSIDNSTANKVLSKTGTENGIFNALIGCSILSAVFLTIYMCYKKYLSL